MAEKCMSNEYKVCAPGKSEAIEKAWDTFISAKGRGLQIELCVDVVETKDRCQ